MNKIYELLKSCPLFHNISEDELNSLLTCLTADNKQYEKDDYIIFAGEKAEFIGVLLNGEANVITEDFWGNRTILSKVNQGNLFAESFALSETNKSPVSVVATQKTEVLFLDCKKILSTCQTACNYHKSLIQNIIKILSDKNLQLTKKIEHTSRRSIKEKLISYLSSVAKEKKSNSFTIAFSRQELADYLNVDRSAMSNELCKLRDAGKLIFHKNEFTLL